MVAKVLRGLPLLFGELLEANFAAFRADPFALFVECPLELGHGELALPAGHGYFMNPRKSESRNSARPIKTDMRDMTVYPKVAPKNTMRK